jgi:regulator of sigma E protease
VDIVPVMNEEEGRLQIRIAPPIQERIVVESDSPAERAGLKKGDRIVSIDGTPAKAWYEKERSPSDAPLSLEVIRETDEGEVRLDLELIPEEVVSDERQLIGVMQRFNLILGLRGGLERQPDGLQEGDFLLTLQGAPLYTREDYEAFLQDLGEESVVLEVLRGKTRKSVTLPPALAGTLEEDMVVAPNGRTNSVVLMPEGALASLDNQIVQDGMLIQGINGQKIETYLDILTTIQNASEEIYTLDIASPEGDETQRVIVKPKPHRDRTYRLGFAPLFDYQTQKLNIPDAIKAGFNCSIYMVKTCYLTLHRMLITHDVSSKNLGGIITIARASYTFAELGIAKLFFFLAILSINLGFLNILPIPLLDGGHLMFLLIEKIKGSPVNERIMGYAQIVGLAFILFLLLFVTWNDIQRLLH